MDLKREQLFEILEEAEGLGLPAPAGVVLKLFREETEEFIKSIPASQIEQIPIFSLMRSGLVPAPGQAGLTLKSEGWERVSTPLPIYTVGGGGSSGGAGGVTQHSLLTQLDYASAGHTGFQPTMTGAMVLALLLPVDGAGSGLDADLLDGNHAAAFQTALVFPLAPNLGGTGIANAAGSTLTLGAATSITGGGTIALGGFVGTVPATANFAMGAGTLSSATINDATIAAHTHAITLSPALLGVGTSQYQVIVTGANPFPPGYSAFLLDGTAGGKTVFAVTNTKTLTLTSTDNFNLTIPATGTAALLATDNVFTTQQFIDGAADEIQLRVQANATQTTNLVTFEDSAANVLGGIDKVGRYFNTLNVDTNSLFIGSSAGNPLASGAVTNIAIGQNAMDALTSGDENVAIGRDALGALTTGLQNIAIGYLALATNSTTGGNLAFGYKALRYCVANANTAVGNNTLENLTSGTRNFGLGYSAGNANQTGSFNVYIGYMAGRGASGQSHSDNIGIGDGVLYKVTTGSQNICIGSKSGTNILATSGSIFIGNYSGYNTNTANSLLIDNRQRASSAVELTNSIIAGVMATTPASQTLTFNAVVSINPQYTAAGISTILNLDSQGSGANADGGKINLLGKTSTTASQAMGLIDWQWVNAVHANRTSRITFSAYDTAVREGFRIEASGSAAMIGFFGVTAVVQQTELTDELTTITYTAPGTPDYAIQDFIDVQGDGSKGFSFANKDEANSVLSVIANLQTRVNELETKLVAYGLLIDVD